MAVATASISGPLNPPQYDVSQSTVTYYYNLSFSAATDTYAAGGITIDLTKAAANWAQNSGLGSILTVWVYSDTNVNSYAFIRGTTVANGKLLIYTANVQFGAVALNASTNPFADKIIVAVTAVRR